MKINTPEMRAKIHHEILPVNDRLAQLGWTREELIEVAHAASAGRNSCTSNDPNTAPGYMAWKEGTRRMREIGTFKGFAAIDVDGAPFTKDAKNNVLFGVASTDRGTGLLTEIPTNRTKKGSTIERIVHSNELRMDIIMQHSLNTVALDKKAKRELMSYWYLCVYDNGGVIRAELSCPLTSKDGYFSDYLERIILLDGSDGMYNTSSVPLDDGGDEFEVEIVRKLS